MKPKESNKQNGLKWSIEQPTQGLTENRANVRNATPSCLFYNFPIQIFYYYLRCFKGTLELAEENCVQRLYRGVICDAT